MSIRDIMTAAASSSSLNAVYVEDVFSSYLYTGNGSAQTITNNIDLSTKGGLLWLKSRINSGIIPEQTNHWLFDTARIPYFLFSNTPDAQGFAGSGSTPSFTSTGFSIPNNYLNALNTSYVSWSFAKQPKFFDIVTWTGNGDITGRQISHSLGSTPGMIIIKRTDAASHWSVTHRSYADGLYCGGILNGTDNFGYPVTYTTDIRNATSSYFILGNQSNLTTSVGGNQYAANINGASYVAYLFAHNAGGFGLYGTDSVVSCGGYTGSTTDVEINLGWEPQYLLVKSTTDTTGAVWAIFDNMRGFTNSLGSYFAIANSTSPDTGQQTIYPTATGFIAKPFNLHTNTNGNTFIYMAIRRGPMKVPTSGTSVFSPIVATGGSVYDITFANNLIPDLIISQKDINAVVVSGTYNSFMFNDRLRGLPQDMTGVTYVNNPGLTSANTTAETTGASPNNSNYFSGSYNSRAVWGGGWSSFRGIFYGLKRANRFFDIVCYTGFGTNSGIYSNITHSLGVSPELVIVKARSDVTPSGGAGGWHVLHTGINKEFLYLNSNSTGSTPYFILSTNSTTFRVVDHPNTGYSGYNYVSYLFATCPGVSKVGSYTGNGSSQTIDCGFTNGARFILIKRTDGVGNWHVWDSARGIVSANDPFVNLDISAAEYTVYDDIDPSASGFIVNQVASGAYVNAPGATYIFLAIA